MAVWEKVLFLVSFDFRNQKNKGSLEGYAFWNDKAETGYTQHIYWIVESFTEHGASSNKYGAWECPVCCLGATLSRNRMRILSPALTCICGSEFLVVRKKCSNLHEIFVSSLILAPVSVWKSFALADSFTMTLCEGCMDVCVCSEVSIRKAQAKVVSIWRRQGASNRSFELWALPLLALHVTWSMQLVLGFFDTAWNSFVLFLHAAKPQSLLSDKSSPRLPCNHHYDLARAKAFKASRGRPVDLGTFLWRLHFGDPTLQTPQTVLN